MTRPRLQLHLSTLLIVSLLAAGLVWLNTGHIRSYIVDYSLGADGNKPIFEARRIIGWPCNCEIAPSTVHITEANLPIELPNIVYYPMWKNAVVAITLLILTAAFSEYLIRRRSKP